LKETHLIVIFTPACFHEFQNAIHLYSFFATLHVVDFVSGKLNENSKVVQKRHTLNPLNPLRCDSTRKYGASFGNKCFRKGQYLLFTILSTPYCLFLIGTHPWANPLSVCWFSKSLLFGIYGVFCKKHKSQRVQHCQQLAPARNILDCDVIGAIAIKSWVILTKAANLWLAERSRAQRRQWGLKDFITTFWAFGPVKTTSIECKSAK